MPRLLFPALLCLVATAGTDTLDREQPSQARDWRATSSSSSTTVLRRVPSSTQRPPDFRSSPVDLGPPPSGELRRHRASSSTSFTDDNALRDGLVPVSAGDGKDPTPQKKKKKDDADDDDEDKKTLSQQIADGKYGLIQKEIYPRPSLRPGIISYKSNPEVPKDNEKNLGGLDAEEIWLAEDHVLVLRGGWFPNHSFNKSVPTPVWPPIDDYNAPPRQVKLPAKPKVPPPFPVQLAEGGPTEFIGPNGTRSQYPFPPPFFPQGPGNFPPGAGFYPPPGNGSLYPPLPPQFPFLPPRNGSFPPPPGSYPPPPGRFPQQPPTDYPYPPGNGQYPPFPYPPPPHGYMPFPNGSLPFGPPPPFLPPLPPGAAFLPPPGNQTDIDEDDPSIYYPPPYDFYYPRDNSTEVPPGPLVPGIILPPPPNFFAPQDADKQRRPTTPKTPYGVYLPANAPSPKPNFIPHSTPKPSLYRPSARPDVAYFDVTTPLPPTPVTVKRPYLTYVPVTTAVRKKKPRPQIPGVEFTTPSIASRPEPPHFVRPQHVQVYHKGESPITSRPFYLDVDNVVTPPAPPQYEQDGLSKLKDILYTTPPTTISYQLGTVIDIDAEKKPNYVTTLAPVKHVESTTEAPPSKNHYFTDLTKRPIYVKDIDEEIRSTPKYPGPSDYDANSVGGSTQPKRDRGNKAVAAPQSQYFAPYQPPTQRAPKTTYYFYEEPHYEQGYVQDITTRKPYTQQQYQPRPNNNFNTNNNNYNNNYNNNNNNNNNFQSMARPQSPEEMLLAQIVETFRQPGSFNVYNSPQSNRNVQPQNYFSSGGNGQNFLPSPRPSPNYGYSTPRPGFYVTKRPQYYTIQQTESPLRYQYNYEDVVQSTEHPLPQRYNSIATPSRLNGPDNNVQTSPKTVYEYSFQQKQPAATNTISGRPTSRPQTSYRPPPPARQQPQPVQQYYEPPVNIAEPKYRTTARPPTQYHRLPASVQTVQTATPDPLQHFYTQQDDGLLDDITKKYFTIFGQKLPAGSDNKADSGRQTNRVNQYGTVSTTPLPPTPAREDGAIPLHDDVLVNYLRPRPTINPDSEYVDTNVDQNIDADDADKGGELVSYELPGNGGGHVYFVTPQLTSPPSERGYSYPAPAGRRLRTRRNKSKQS